MLGQGCMPRANPTLGPSVPWAWTGCLGRHAQEVVWRNMGVWDSEGCCNALPKLWQNHSCKQLSFPSTWWQLVAHKQQKQRHRRISSKDDNVLMFMWHGCLWSKKTINATFGCSMSPKRVETDLWNCEDLIARGGGPPCLILIEELHTGVSDSCVARARQCPGPTLQNTLGTAAWQGATPSLEQEVLQLSACRCLLIEGGALVRVTSSWKSSSFKCNCAYLLVLQWMFSFFCWF